jgi:hypothetical protein
MTITSDTPLTIQLLNLTADLVATTVNWGETSILPPGINYLPDSGNLTIAASAKNVGNSYRLTFEINSTCSTSPHSINFDVTFNPKIRSMSVSSTIPNPLVAYKNTSINLFLASLVITVPSPAITSLFWSQIEPD